MPFLVHCCNLSYSDFNKPLSEPFQVVCLTYILFPLLQNYVLPWFQQRRQQEERLADIQSSVEQLETNIRDMVTSVNDSTKALRVSSLHPLHDN